MLSAIILNKYGFNFCEILIRRFVFRQRMAQMVDLEIVDGWNPQRLGRLRISLPFFGWLTLICFIAWGISAYFDLASFTFGISQIDITTSWCGSKTNASSKCIMNSTDKRGMGGTIASGVWTKYNRHIVTFCERNIMSSPAVTQNKHFPLVSIWGAKASGHRHTYEVEVLLGADSIFSQNVLLTN